MDGGAYLETKGRMSVSHNQRDTLPGAVPIPTSTPTCVIVKSFKTAVDKVRGTIKLRTQMDNSFSIFLRGKCTEEQFQHTIDGINWFANLLHHAEVEYYAEVYSSAVAWKDYYQELEVQEVREQVLTAYCKEHDLMFSPARPRISNDEQMKTYLNKVVSAMHDFIDDENKRVYIANGVQWHYPEKNQWRWLEIHILPDGSDLPKPEEPLVALPTEPKFGDHLKFSVLETLAIDDHAEYIIHIATDLKEWYPTTDTYILRRFNNFREFHASLTQYMAQHRIDAGMPEVPEGRYIGRKSKSTLQKRKALFQDLMECIAATKALHTAPPVLEFFGIQSEPNSWKFTPYLFRHFEHA